jgi:aryl-alcohol dehydrogenase-like predicted oxidoreductase
METRRLGKTGERLSVVGFGGIVVKDVSPAEAARLVVQALDRGINYVDVAPSYGNAEERLGPALAPYRHSVFLACKTQERTARGAREELHRSLERLHTETFDLYQLHAVSTMEEVERVLGPGGAMEALVEAREQGLVRYLGFSSHADDAAVALLQRFPFDTMLFPFNWVAWHQGGFGPRAMAAAKRAGVGILALKALAKRALREGEERPWPKCWYVPVDDPAEAQMALNWTLSLDVTAAVSPSHAELLWWMCDAADRYCSLSDEERKEVATRSVKLQPLFSRPTP